MIVVLDSNIWLNSLALQNDAGSAVRFFLRQNRARLALPEVIQLEVERNLRRRLETAVTEIRKQHRQLLGVFGKLPEIVLPDDAAISDRVKRVFEFSGLDIIKIPFALDSARASFLKTVDGVPPSGEKDQQFKDGVIWADCVALLTTDDVTLVTTDTGFYREHKYENGIADNLAGEIQGLPHTLTLVRQLGELLKSIRREVPLDEMILATALLERARPQIEGLLERNGFSLGDRLAIDSKLYATEDPKIIYGEVTISYQCNAIGEDRNNARLEQAGSFTYDVETRTVATVRLDRETLTYTDSDGVSQQRTNQYAHMSGLVLGHRQVSHGARHPLT